LALEATTRRSFSGNFPHNHPGLKLPCFLRVLFGTEKELAKAIRNMLGFAPCNIHLYHLAFRHRSAAVEIAEGKKISNERLEFLGDSILGAIISDYLFFKYPFKDEGFLTQMRSKFVSRNHLNKLSLKLGIDKMIKTESESVSNFRSMGGDAFEALIGAIFVDKGFNFTKHIIIDRIIRLHIDLEELQNRELNYKSKLIEYIQKEKVNLEFRVIEEVGKGYEKLYVVEAVIDGKSFGKGMGHSIKVAEQSAAELACAAIFSDQ
jgi:ribonuclease III